MTSGQARQHDDPGTPEELQLENQLCFALYAASRAVTELYRPLLTELGLTYPQYLVLLVLWERDARPIKDIAAALQLDYGTISPLLKRLEANGLITRHRAGDNESRVLVSLTDAGFELRARVAELPDALRCALHRTDQIAPRDLLAELRHLTTAAHTAELPSLSELGRPE